MFDRIELKTRGKAAFLKNFWPCVLVALILSMFVYNANSNGGPHAQYNYTIGENYVTERIGAYGFGIYRIIPTIPGAIINLSIGLAIILIIAQILVFNVLEVGGCRFFTANALNSAGSVAQGDTIRVSELLEGFRSGYYSHTVVTMLIRNVKLLLWSLLLIIPGIVKHYEYLMIPYLLAEYPDMTTEDAFAYSRRMMYGAKLDAFVLDLTFIGWELLGAITFGLVNIFWTKPYEYSTHAELYLALKPGMNG